MEELGNAAVDPTGYYYNTRRILNINRIIILHFTWTLLELAVNFEFRYRKV